MACGPPWEALTLITRSLAINEETNLVVYDAGFAGQLEKSFQEDLKYSKQLTYVAWNPRSFVEKILELFSIPMLGVVALAYQGITYTSREKVIDIGPIHATADTQKTIPLSPLMGGAVLVGGIVLVVVGAKKA